MVYSKATRLTSRVMLAGFACILGACVGKESTSSSATGINSSVPSGSASSSAFVPPPEQTPGDPELIMAINAGGPAALLEGIAYQADAYYSGGSTYDSDVDIAGTDEDAVYLTERYDDSSYAIPVENGRYNIRLNFSETYHDADGERVFNVHVEGREVLSNVDIFKAVGIRAAMIETVNNIAVVDGLLDIEFESVSALAKVTGIVVYKVDTLQTHAEIGKAIFDTQCKSCHAATDKAVGTKEDESGHDLASLTLAADAMPPALVEDVFGTCDAECAYYTAKYIASVNPFFGRPIPGPEPDMATGDIDAAPPVMSRLSKDEYNNAIRDIFGIDSRPADDFPQDQAGTFNNDNSALSISSQHIEAFNKAALDIAVEVVDAATTGNSTAIPCDLTNESCAQTVITTLGLKVWRRPLANEESAGLKVLYDVVYATTNNRKTAMTALVRTLLLSPNFIFRPEFDQNLRSDIAQPLGAYELASRLSFFLWGSTPDDELLAKAADSSITTDATLRAQVARMLEDSRSDTLLDNFAMTWLGYANYGKHEVDTNQFPQYTDEIEEALLNETKTFLGHILKEGRPISEILDAKYTYLNEPLANFYGVTGVSGNGMQRYEWPEGSNRIGLLGHGSALTAHSHSNKTSPVKRGTWVMDKIMCDRPPEPDGNVIAQFPELPEGLNPRAESELHKESSPICSSCHVYVDPIGYGMENFSPIGQWRDVYPNGDRVDASSVLPTGEVFSSLVELAEILAPKGQYTLCTISYALTYATGRRVNTLYQQGQPSDYAAVYQIYQNTKDSAHSISDIFTEIVLSPAFRMRRGADSQ